MAKEKKQEPVTEQTTPVVDTAIEKTPAEETKKAAPKKAAKKSAKKAPKKVKQKKFTVKQIAEIESEVLAAQKGITNVLKRNEIRKRIFATYRKQLLK